MTLRTPRRRISPQTKRRCRAIKGFFKRALGSSSQPDLQITSSIAINVTDIKHKIVGLEQQLNEVSKQCRDVSCHENTSRKESESLAPTELRDEVSQEELTSRQLKGERKETKIIYKTSEREYEKSDDSVCISKANNDTSKVKSINKMTEYCNEQIPKTKKKKSKLENEPIDLNVNHNFRKHKTKSTYENFVSAYSTSSFHSLDQFKEMFHANPGYSGYGEERKHRTKIQDYQKDKMYREHPNLECYDYQHEQRAETNTKKKPKRAKELDEDFIADIIKRQYKPVKMFGRRASDLSQFSAPVCRDHELCLAAEKYMQQDQQVCSCCCEGRHFTRHAHHSDHTDMRSVCDARLYSVKRNSRIKHRKKHADAYNSDFYDLVPVKEKTSPKTRRKFFEDNMIPSTYCREVPPSPRSQRPRLNLKAQYYTESDNNSDILRNPGKRVSPKSAMRHQEIQELEEDYYPSANNNKRVLHRSGMRHRENEDLEENYSSEMREMGKRKHQADFHREMGTMSSLQDPAFDALEHRTAVETPLNKTQETISSTDKTDKALCEIKDILQNFLQEIKKEASSHSNKSECASKTTDSCNNAPNDMKNMPNNNGHRFNNNNYNTAPCQVPPAPYVSTLPHFANTCCYPMVPVCPMNCMQNSYAAPSTSFTCNNCSTKSNIPNNNCNIPKNDAANDTLNCETDELIKEIYKFVSQSPKFCRKQGDSVKGDNISKRAYSKVLTSRSAGGSTRVCRHDAKVGTPKINGVSKSCEAIGVNILSDAYNSDTNASYSDTILEKFSRDATAITESISETEFSTEVSEVDKAKRNKFAKVMKSLGLFMKNKKDIIEEMSESESTVDVDVKKKPPFRQDIENYTMHGQEYYRSPPVSPHYRPEYPQDYRPPYNPDVPYYDPRVHQCEHGSPHPQCHSEHIPTAPPYSHPYEGYQNQMQPQVPLCLKEIEVKSIGCQSERKMSFFRKLTQKVPQPTNAMQRGNVAKNCSTQTSQNKPKMFNWKLPPQKGIDIKNNPIAYGFETQKKLAHGDTKLRKALLKKLMYKRNPFSPGNLIMRTLLGKDKSSFGEAPVAYRPRMFL